MSLNKIERHVLNHIRFDEDGNPRDWTEAETDALVYGFSRAQARGRGLRESLFAAVNEWVRHHVTS